MNAENQQREMSAQNLERENERRELFYELVCIAERTLLEIAREGGASARLAQATADELLVRRFGGTLPSAGTLPNGFTSRDLHELAEHIRDPDFLPF